MAQPEVGRVFPSFDVVVDVGRAMQVADALGARSTVFGSELRAAEAGLPGTPVIPVYFSNAVQFEATGVNPVAESVSTRALLGGQEYWFDNGPVFVGENLHGSSRVSGVEPRTGRSGPLTVVTIETTYARPNGTTALRAVTRSIDFSVSPS